MTLPLSKDQLLALRVTASPWLQIRLDDPDLIPTSEWLSRRLVDVKEAAAEVGTSRSGWYRMMAEGQAPPAIRLGPKTSRWLFGEVCACRDALIRAGRRHPASGVGRPAKRTEIRTET